MSSLGGDHQPVLDALGAYALDAVSETERAEVERHLEGCSSCREELEVLSAVVHHLPAAVPLLAPPGEMKARIMAQVESEAELLRAAGSTADRVPRRRWARAGALLWGPFGAAAAASVLVLVAVAGFFLGGAGRPQPGPGRTVAARVEPSSAPHGRAALLVRPGGGATLEVSGLPEPARGRVYEVWLVRRGGGAPAATDALFTVNARGRSHVEVPGDLRHVEKILVTSEPRGGSDVPSQLVPLISAPTS